jgi:hypothetical protein
MTALGYEKADTDADLTVEAYIESTDPAETLQETLGSGRIHLQMKAGDEILRQGASANLSVPELDTLSLDTVSEIVANFLEGLPAR